MSWFKKRKDVIDLTYLAKRGLVKLPKQEDVEFVNPMAPSPSSSGGGDALGFLSSLASSSSPSSSLGSDEKLDTGVKNKVEDVEFKLNTLIRKVDALLDRLDLVEKKLSRNERAGN